jgi:hypothetical protein
MNGKQTDSAISVTIPENPTWKSVLQAIETALGDLDGPMAILQRRSDARQRIMRQVALDTVAEWNSQSKEMPPGCRIAPRYDILPCRCQSQHLKRYDNARKKAR